jgi:hypothetical protein
VNVHLIAEPLDELGVVSLVAVLGHDAEERLAGLDGLDGDGNGGGMVSV